MATVEAFDIFYKSKLNTLCKTKKEAEETKKYYTLLKCESVSQESENESGCESGSENGEEFAIKEIKKDDEDVKYIVYSKKTSEIYPSIHYSSPNFNVLTNTVNYKKLFDFI